MQARTASLVSSTLPARCRLIRVVHLTNRVHRKSLEIGRDKTELDPLYLYGGSTPLALG